MAWSKYKNVQYGTVFPGSNLTDFPLLVKIAADSDIASECSGGGGIKFTSADGMTDLAFGLYQSSDITTGDIIARVKASPITSGTTGNPIVRIYYSSSESTTEDKAGVMDGNYGLFMPLEEDPSGSAPQMFDWVSETNVGTSAGSMTSGDLVDGQVGKGLDFDGSDDKIGCGDLSACEFSSGQSFTLECHVNVPSGTSLSDLPGLLNKGVGDSGVTNPWYLLRVMSTGRINFHARNTSNVDAFELNEPSGASLADDSWHSVCGRADADGNTAKIFRDGSETASTSFTLDDAYGTSSRPFQIGTADGTRKITGGIDEVRVSGVARSADWLAYAYENDFNNSDTVTLGSEQGGGGGDEFNASASLTLSGISISAAGTVVPPDFNVTADVILGGVQIAVVADSEVPNYAVTADIILGGISISGVGTTAVPTYNANASLILGGVQITAVGDVENFFSASADITLGSVSALVVGTVDNPGFEGTADLILGGTEVSAVGDTEVPNYNATVDITLGGIEVISVGTTDVPSYNATVDITVGGVEVASIATFTSVSFSVSLKTLLCTARTTQQDYINFVESFFEIIQYQNLLDTETFDYLDQGTEDGILTYEDRDYWLIQIARVNLDLTGRTFGSDTPTILSEADPLGLTKDADGNLRDDVLIIDPQAVNESTIAQDGPVKVISPNSCTTPDGLTKNPSGFFTGGTGVAWYYQLLSDLHSINEFGGGGGRNRFLDAASGITTKTLTCYVRFSTLHKITTQIYLGKRPTGTHALKIVVQGYPTDARVTIPVGTYTPGTPDTIPTGFNCAGIRIGASSTQSRNNLWFRWLDFIGKVWVDDFNGNSGYIFACPIIFSNSANTGIEFRETIVRDFLPIHPGNSQAANYPQYVDIGHGSRTFGELQEYTGIYIRSENSKILYSYFQAAGEDIATAFSEYNGEEYATVYNLRGRGIRSDGGNNFEVGYVKAEGFTSGDYIGLVCRSSQANRTGIHIYDIIVTSNGYKNFLIQSGDVGVESISGTVERVFSYNAGTEGFQTAGGSLAHFYAGEGSLTVKNSIFAYNLNGQIIRNGATTPGVLIDTVDNNNVGSVSGGVILDQVITWHCGVHIGKTNGWQFADTALNTSKVINSLLYGVPEQLKEENQISGYNIYDAPVVMAIYGGALMSNHVVSDNNIARDLTDLNSTAAMVHENPDNVGTLYTVADEIVPGFENNTAITPAYISPTTGNFNLPAGNSLLSRFDSTMIFSVDDIRPWDYNPLTELCAVTPTPTTEFAYRSIYAALYGHFDVSI